MYKQLVHALVHRHKNWNDNAKFNDTVILPDTNFSLFSIRSFVIRSQKFVCPPPKQRLTNHNLQNKH